MIIPPVKGFSQRERAGEVFVKGNARILIVFRTNSTAFSPAHASGFQKNHDLKVTTTTDAHGKFSALAILFGSHAQAALADLGIEFVGYVIKQQLTFVLSGPTGSFISISACLQGNPPPNIDFYKVKAQKGGADPVPAPVQAFRSHTIVTLEPGSRLTFTAEADDGGPPADQLTAFYRKGETPTISGVRLRDLSMACTVPDLPKKTAEKECDTQDPLRRPGVYGVTFGAEDTAGNKTFAEFIVVVRGDANQAPKVRVAKNDLTAAPGAHIIINVTGSDGDAVDWLELTWRSPELLAQQFQETRRTANSVESTFSADIPAGAAAGDIYTVTFQVTDSQGAKDVVTVRIRVR